MHSSQRISPLRSGLWALTIGAAALLSLPANASATPKAKAKHQHSHRMQVSTGGQLGAQVTGMSDDLRAFFGAPEGVGILVDQVAPDTPAAKAGLKSGDVITKVNGTAIDGAMDIFVALSRSKKGDKVSIEIIRTKKKRTLKATLDGTAPLRLHWGSAQAWKDPFGNGHPRGPMPTPFGSDLHDPFGQGDIKIEFGQDFPLLKGPKAMQEKIQKLEERLNRLEGAKKGKKKKKTKKSERSSVPKDIESPF